MTHPRIDKSDWRNLVLKPWTEGRSQRAIAADLGVVPAHICKWLAVHATLADQAKHKAAMDKSAFKYFSCHKRALRAEPIIRKCVKQGMSSYDIAPLIGVHACTVRIYMDKLGIRDKAKVPAMGNRKGKTEAAQPAPAQSLIPNLKALEVRATLHRLGIIAKVSK